MQAVNDTRRKEMIVSGATSSQAGPGLAFWLVTDAGFAVGLVTHEIPRIGALVWIAEPTFDEEPSASDVLAIDRWRWCVFFPVKAAVWRKIVTPIAHIDIPKALQPFPAMRGGNKWAGWQMIVFEGRRSRPIGPATDPSVSIYQVVNDTRLKEMIVSGWRPADKW
jgi:hypothetical protein